MATKDGRFSTADFKKFLDESPDEWATGPVCLPGRIFLTRGDQVIEIDGKVASLGRRDQPRAWRKEFGSWIDAAEHIHAGGLWQIDLVIKQAFINQARAEGRDP